MAFYNPLYRHVKRDLPAWLISFMLAACAEQRDAGIKMQFSYSPAAADSSAADSIFDAPSSISR